MFAPLLAPAHMPGLIISGGMVLAAAAVFATTGPETRSESDERPSKSRYGRNTRSMLWDQGRRYGSRANTPTGEYEEGGAAHSRSLPFDVIAARDAAARRRKALEERAGGWNSPAESRIAEAAALLPHENFVTLEDVVGMDDIVHDMRRRIVLPLLRQDSSLCVDVPPTSLLLHGPSGCGKRTLALAVAREARAVFIDARAALDHWHGPAAEGMALVWSVAQVLQPAVVYVEGVEFLLGVLCSTRATDAGPSQAAALGRGYCGASGNDVVLIGTTHEIANLGAEVADQFQLQCSVAAPGAVAREALLVRFLFQDCRRMKLTGIAMDLWGEGASAEGGISEVPATLTVRQCVARTKGFSGSALRDLVRRTVEVAVDDAVASGAVKGDITGAHLARALAGFVPLNSR